MIGMLNSTTEWLFAYPGRLSTTTSGADRLLEQSREELAAIIWREVAQVAGLHGDLPPWQIVRERRATFAATPEENARRPGAATAFGNLYLAGDWTDTGLPATIEGAIRSGNRAAELALRHKHRHMMSDTTTRFAGRGARPSSMRWSSTSAARPTRFSPTSSRTGTGCSSSKPTPRSRPNTC